MELQDWPTCTAGTRSLGVNLGKEEEYETRKGKIVYTEALLCAKKFKYPSKGQKGLFKYVPSRS